MDDKEKNLNNLQNDLNPQNNAGSFPNQNNNGKNLFSKDNLKTMGKNTLKNTGKNLARDARQALLVMAILMEKEMLWMILLLVLRELSTK